MELGPGASVTSELTLLRPLNAGAMGSVWIARDHRFAAPVAVKFVARKMAKDPASLARFRREVEAATQLNSPHVVQILDHGEAPDGRPYLVMELLEGESLEQRLEREGRLDMATTAQIVRQVGGALDVAHARGIVHRDIKPDNLFIVQGTEPPLVKVLDFGMAKQTRVKGGSIVTATGVAVGTPLYMSPEQVLGQKDVDYRSDLWALGVVTYRMLAGRLPFRGATPHALTFKICKGEFLPLAEVGVPVELTPWFERALAPNKEKRFGSAREMVLRFESRAATASIPERGFGFSDEETTLFFDKHSLAGHSLALPLERLSDGGMEPEPSTEREPAVPLDEPTTGIEDGGDDAPTHLREGRQRVAAIAEAVARLGDPTGGADEEVNRFEGASPTRQRPPIGRLAATVPRNELPPQTPAPPQRPALSSAGASSAGASSPAPSSAPVPASPRSERSSSAVVASRSATGSVARRAVVAFVLAGCLAAGLFFVFTERDDRPVSAEVTVPNERLPARSAPPREVSGENPGAPLDQPRPTASVADTARSSQDDPPDTRGRLDESGVGKLSVLCRPGCYDVRIDGNSYGPSPVYGRELSGGDHELLLHQPNGPSRRMVVQVIPGEETVETVPMPRARPTAAAGPPAASSADPVDGPPPSSSALGESSDQPPGGTAASEPPTSETPPAHTAPAEPPPANPPPADAPEPNKAPEVGDPDFD